MREGWRAGRIWLWHLRQLLRGGSPWDPLTGYNNLEWDWWSMRSIIRTSTLYLPFPTIPDFINQMYRTLLKLNASYAYPALSNGEPQEPYVSTCLSSARSMAKLANTARSIGWATASTPLFIWGCWVAARVLFGELRCQIEIDTK